jgi:hypothetical protein
VKIMTTSKATNETASTLHSAFTAAPAIIAIASTFAAASNEMLSSGWFF